MSARVVVLLLVALLVALPSAAVAEHDEPPGKFIKVGENHYKDPQCGTPDALFNVRTFQDVDYEGRRVDLCGVWTDFCWIPFGNPSQYYSACRIFGVDIPTLNDVISSYKVMAVHGGVSCRVRIYEHRDRTGGNVAHWDPIDVPNLVPWPNDALSSIGRTC